MNKWLYAVMKIFAQLFIIFIMKITAKENDTNDILQTIR